MLASSDLTSTCVSADDWNTTGPHERFEMRNQPAKGFSDPDQSVGERRGAEVTEPADVAARETLSFVIASLPTDCQRIVEAGCGDGRLAAMLLFQGLNVVAVDNSADSADLTRALGVKVTCGEWNDFSDGVFDAVLFTRSLHHMADPPEAVRHALQMLRDGGRIIVDELAPEHADEATVGWFSSFVETNVLGQCSVPPSDESLIASLLTAPDLTSWSQHLHPGIHDYAVTRRAVVQAGPLVLEQSGPYLYRYLLDWLAAEPNGIAIAEAALMAEREMIDRCQITPLGRRLVVARNTES